MTSDRFWSRVAKSDGCWTWTGASTPKGYGHMGVDGREVYAHRFSYELLVGPIPAGLEIDHLCRNRACVNPAHLEPVSSLENSRRGWWSLRTHCSHGHEYTPENTQIYRGYRLCRACKKRNNAQRYPHAA